MDLQRAYATLEIKSIDDDLRIIEGVASTPEPDRTGDIMEPKGAKFSLPLPLLWQHKADQPIGKVLSADVRADGIRIRAQVAKGIARIDEVWAMLKQGLVGGLSIGFRGDEAKPPKFLPKTGGFHFESWDWFELSAVTVPMNASATIQLVKSLDAPFLAASGAGASPVASPSAGVTASARTTSSRGRPAMKKTYQEQIKDFESTRAAKVAERDAIQAKASDEGRAKDQGEREAFDAASNEIEQIDLELKDLGTLVEQAKSAAVEVKGANPDEASRSRLSTPVVTVRENTPPGIAMARVVIAKMASYAEMKRGNFVSAKDLAQQHYAHDTRVVNYFKTAVAGGITTDTNWATDLVEPVTMDFVEYLRHKSIVGRLNLQRRPFNIRTPRQTTGGAGYWVGEGKPKPLTKFHFDAVTLPYTKVASIAVITQELARFSNPSAETIVRDQLAAACLERLDTDLIDPDKAVSAGVNPASLTNGVTALSSAGTSAANVITDINNLLEQFILNRQDVSGLVLVMPNTLALAASLMITTNGVQQFPGLSVSGGNLLGIPVIASQYAASGASYGNMVIAIDQNAVALADDGGFTVDVSTEASLQMDDAPTNDASTGTGQTSVSMFQTNSIAIRAEREIHWVKLRSTAVSYIDDVTWGASGSPF